eukprot:8694341-Ditylum_brightwellii.AAC.1
MLSASVCTLNCPQESMKVLSGHGLLFSSVRVGVGAVVVAGACLAVLKRKSLKVGMLRKVKDRVDSLVSRVEVFPIALKVL